MASGGVRNSSNITFWSESRISVKSKLRNERKRTSSAASDAAKPTFRTSANINSCAPKNVFILFAERCLHSAPTKLAKAASDVKGRRRSVLPCDALQAMAFHAVFWPRTTRYEPALVEARPQNAAAWRRQAERAATTSRTPQADFANPAIILVSHAAQKTIGEAQQSARRRHGAITHRLRLLPNFRHRRTQTWRRGRCDPARHTAGRLARQTEWRDARPCEIPQGAAGARALAVPYRRCVHLRTLRLPRATGIFAAQNRPGTGRRAVIPTAGRPRHWLDQ